MAQKNIKPALKSFSYNLTDYDLGFICSRLHHNYQDDLFQFLEFMAEIDGENIQPVKVFLESAKNYSEFFAILDEIKSSVAKEYERRGNSLQELA